MKKTLLATSLALATLGFSNVTLASNGDDWADKYLTTVQTQGEIGIVKVNPYDFAPLTAIIDLNGFSISDVKVRIEPKKGGAVIEYPVDQVSLTTHNGIPVFGLYADYDNTVMVEYVKNGKKVKENYKIKTAPVKQLLFDGQVRSFPEVKSVKVDKKFRDRLYLVNHMGADESTKGWDSYPMIFVTDTAGEVRWFMDWDAVYDQDTTPGVAMGFHLSENGELYWGQDHYYARYDMLGRKVFNREIPRGFTGFSHEIQEMPNGHYLLRVAKEKYLREDGKRLDTWRDHVIEVDTTGNVVHTWDFNKIFDNMRDDLLAGLDSGAVCLNVDESHAGETMDIEPDAAYGDLPGVAAGRNWAHINSIDYDASDDSIIVSMRHQGTAKVGRDGEVKWILAADKGWGDLSDKVLTPVDSKGNKLDCDDNGRCAGSDFDFPWTQHTSWLTSRGTLVSFDNGDGRYFEQPAMPTMKYSRGVEYNINEDNMTVEQTFEYGKERGYEWYSPITSNIEWREDKDTFFMYSASAGLFTGEPGKHFINEVAENGKVKVELTVNSMAKTEPSYRALIVEPGKLFN
ncbi:aryl-sulfate sulfotransferase [Ferrimonas lipolytica]|uniref:Aryl-sulfate sulfotransferase n=1 Tax=Ferrimonas lipolytica TaxID=2724191 RepID=A0A6H1UK11_9GAMM|nr:aryl-sulfate sulfotransferase [Ferrimonas lipolytica]QIZ78142.1 aryl-sulfate sulfotransferase [Ferrimonas lipolytica]